MTQLFDNKHKLEKSKQKKEKKAEATHAFLNNKHIKMLIKSCFSTENDGKILKYNAEINTAWLFHMCTCSQGDAKTKQDTHYASTANQRMPLPSVRKHLPC